LVSLVGGNLSVSTSCSPVWIVWKWNQWKSGAGYLASMCVSVYLQPSWMTIQPNPTSCRIQERLNDTLNRCMFCPAWKWKIIAIKYFWNSCIQSAMKCIDRYIDKSVTSSKFIQKHNCVFIMYIEAVIILPHFQCHYGHKLCFYMNGCWVWIVNIAKTNWLIFRCRDVSASIAHDGNERWLVCNCSQILS